jgi:hypothetical protein
MKACVFFLIIASFTGPSIVKAAGIDLGEWHLIQENSSCDFVFPAGTVVEDRGYVIIARNCEKDDFERFWGVELASHVIFINSGDQILLINGDELFTLRDPDDIMVDGPTIAMAESGGESVQRNNPGDPPGDETSWTRFDWDNASPGSGAGSSSNAGIVINEFSDALGSGNYIYEFVELFNDEGLLDLEVLYSCSWARPGDTVPWKVALINRSDFEVNIDGMRLDVTGPFALTRLLWSGFGTLKPSQRFEVWFELTVHPKAPLGVYTCTTVAEYDGEDLASDSFECELVE